MVWGRCMYCGSYHHVPRDACPSSCWITEYPASKTFTFWGGLMGMFTALIRMALRRDTGRVRAGTDARAIARCIDAMVEVVDVWVRG